MITKLEVELGISVGTVQVSGLSHFFCPKRKMNDIKEKERAFQVNIVEG